MNDKPIAAVAGRIGRASTSELLVEKARLETAWIKETENIAKPYSLNLGICCRELSEFTRKLFFTAYGVENGEEIELNLWMLLYHRTIKRFRETVRQTGQESKKSSSHSSSTAKALTDGFHSFICAGVGFYMSLLSDIVRVYGYEPTEQTFKDIVFLCSPYNKEISKPSEEIVERAREIRFAMNMCYRIFIRLGDLVRYSEIYTSKSKNWEQSMSFYMIALHINPYVGNAYNQLGLLEAYLRSQLGAVVYAIKGLLVDRPFRTSANNLSTTFTRIYNGIAHSRPHSEKKSQKNDQNYKRNFENSFLEMIAISLFDLSTADTYFCKKMNGLFEELSVIISQNIDSSEVYMFGILVIPVGMLHLHFSQQSSPGDFMVLNPKSIDKLVHIVLKFLSTLLIVSSHEIPNSECHMRLLKIINLGLHWLRSNKSLFAPSVRNALAMSKNELANFYSELYFEDFKDANLSSSKPARGDVPLDEYINYGMFAPFKNLSRLGRPAGREHNADRQSVDKDASRVRIKSIADSILIILDIPALPPAPTIPLTDSLEQKTTQKKKPLIARVEIPSTVGITGSGVRFHPDNEDIQTDLGFFAGYTDPYCSMPSKITGPLDAHDGSREFGGEHQRPSTLIRSVFNASSDSFHPHLSGTPLLQDMLMYPYGSCDVQRLAEGETRSIDTPYIGTIDAPASDTGRHISSDPVNTISFLGLENYSAPFDNPNSKPPPSLSPTG